MAPSKEDLGYARVCETRCSTCIFGPDSPITPARRAEYQATWRRRDAFQNCHMGTFTSDKALVCRGFYDWCEAIGWWPLLLQLAHRLDRLRFVAVPEIPSQPEKTIPRKEHP